MRDPNGREREDEIENETSQTRTVPHATTAPPLAAMHVTIALLGEREERAMWREGGGERGSGPGTNKGIQRRRERRVRTKLPLSTLV